MEIETSGNEIIIKGNIKSISHYHQLMQEINMLLSHAKDIRIYIADSISITSSIIGYLCKIVEEEKAFMTLYIKNEDLYDILQDLNLTKTLNAQKI